MARPSEPVWILLRGLSRESAHWGGFPDQLRAALPAARVIALDLPGNGLARHLPSPWSVAAMVAHCRGELGRRGERGPFHLLAMSLGAMVAVEWCRQAPQELRGCVLINTSLRPFSPFWRRLQPRNYGTLLALALPGQSAQQAERAILRMTSQATARHACVLDDWVAIRRQRPVRSVDALRQLVAAMRYRADTAPAPALLLLASEQDQLVHSSCSHAIARVWGCPMAVHPWAGHDLPLDDATWVATQAAGWAAALPP